MIVHDTLIPYKSMCGIWLPHRPSITAFNTLTILSNNQLSYILFQTNEYIITIYTFLFI